MVLDRYNVAGLMVEMMANYYGASLVKISATQDTLLLGMLSFDGIYSWNPRQEVKPKAITDHHFTISFKKEDNDPDKLGVTQKESRLIGLSLSSYGNDPASQVTIVMGIQIQQVSHVIKPLNTDIIIL